jgi:hypothetical protein
MQHEFHIHLYLYNELFPFVQVKFLIQVNKQEHLHVIALVEHDNQQTFLNRPI